MIPLWATKYIGVPFKDHGFDLKGWHCWGLVRYVMLHERGIELPTYDAISADELIKIAREIQTQVGAGPWVAVIGERRAFDVLLMRGRSDPNGPRSKLAVHCGIMVDSNTVLHVREGTHSVCVPITDRSVAFTIVTTYRHRQLIREAA